MIANAMIFYPVQTVICAVTVLWLMAFISQSPRRNSIRMAMAVLLLPLWPILAVRCAASLIVDLCDLVTVDRTWCRPIVRAAQYLGNKL